MDMDPCRYVSLEYDYYHDDDSLSLFSLLFR